MKLMGCDVFLYSAGATVPELPKAIGPLRLELISNRGTRIWPTSAAKLDYFADEFRFRFTGEGNKAVERADVDAVLKELIALGKAWTRVQVLWMGEDGTGAFSQPY